MAFGVFGLLASIGVLFATISGVLILQPMGYVYSLLIFVGVALPCLVIGNYVDDMRRNAVIAQVFYSLVAIALSGFLIYARGITYNWTVPLFNMTVQVAVGNVAALIIGIQSLIVLYLAVRWNKVVPPPGVRVVRDRTEAKGISEGLLPTPLGTGLLAPDGESELTEEEAQRVLGVRKITTAEGMAILCSNCGGANPLTNLNEDNTLNCAYCGVKLGISSVFVPCENHPEYLAATTCAVCGHHFCRLCLTAQEPPIDKRWESSTLFLCRKCFEGRYRPAVTTTSLVIPIEGLFSTAGGRFSTVGRIYQRFLGTYGSVLKHTWRLPLELLAALGKRAGKGGGGSNDCAGALILIIVIIVAIPVIAGLLLLAGAIVLIPLLFYAGLVGVIVEAVKILQRTDFVSLDTLRVDQIVKKKRPKVKESRLRLTTRSWEDEIRIRKLREERRRMKERQRRERRAESFWGWHY